MAKNIALGIDDFKIVIEGNYAFVDKTHGIKSNRESGSGCYDIMIMPRDVKNVGIIIEFKTRSPREEPNLEKTAKRALEQIEDKLYEVEFRERGVTNIKKLALVFDKKESLWATQQQDDFACLIAQGPADIPAVVLMPNERQPHK